MQQRSGAGRPGQRIGCRHCASPVGRRSPRQVSRALTRHAGLFVFGLFLFHTILLFDIAAVMVHAETWLTELLGKHRYGKAIILGCFCFLFVGHVAEAAAWALFLRWQRLVPTVSDGLYFAAVTITTLGYGDVVLPTPWRQLGPLIAIAGILKFGCSTALLFVLMQAVWIRNL